MYKDKSSIPSREIIVNDNVHPSTTAPELEMENAGILVLLTPLLFLMVWNDLKVKDIR